MMKKNHSVGPLKVAATVNIVSTAAPVRADEGVNISIDPPEAATERKEHNMVKDGRTQLAAALSAFGPFKADTQLHFENGAMAIHVLGCGGDSSMRFDPRDFTAFLQRARAACADSIDVNEGAENLDMDADEFAKNESRPAVRVRHLFHALINRGDTMLITETGDKIPIGVVGFGVRKKEREEIDVAEIEDLRLVTTDRGTYLVDARETPDLHEGDLIRTVDVEPSPITHCIRVDEVEAVADEDPDMFMQTK